MRVVHIRTVEKRPNSVFLGRYGLFKKTKKRLRFSSQAVLSVTVKVEPAIGLEPMTA